MMHSKEIHMSEYINSGLPLKKHFKIVTTELPKIGPNQVLVKNLWLSVDPYMRFRMASSNSYFSPFALNAPLEGEALGVVQSSQHPNFKSGDFIRSSLGWREFFVVNGDQLEKLNTDSNMLPHLLNVLGKPALTAYAGLFKIGELKEGETVFVSAASGAVGSIACQIAKLKNCKVIGSAGGKEKVKWLKDKLGVDAAFDYKGSEDLIGVLKKTAPEGIDVYFDNVGGEQLQAAIDAMKAHGRIVLCGMIAEYNADKSKSGPNNLLQLIFKRITMQGFVVAEFESIRDEFTKNMMGWIKQGKIKTFETVISGIENVPEAFVSLFSGGQHVGKILIKL